MSPSKSDFKMKTYLAMSKIIMDQQKIIDDLYAIACQSAEIDRELVGRIREAAIATKEVEDNA